MLLEVRALLYWKNEIKSFYAIFYAQVNGLNRTCNNVHASRFYSDTWNDLKKTLATFDVIALSTAKWHILESDEGYQTYMDAAKVISEKISATYDINHTVSRITDIVTPDMIKELMTLLDPVIESAIARHTKIAKLQNTQLAVASPPTTTPSFASMWNAHNSTPDHNNNQSASATSSSRP